MFINFLKVTFRTLSREKVYAIINIAGLSIAIACCLILGLYLRKELTYDQHNKKYRQIYRVVTDHSANGQTTTFATTSKMLGKLLKKEYADVYDYVRFWKVKRKVLLRNEDKAFYWDTTSYVSNNVFDVFDHKFIYGDPKTARAGQFCAVSKTFAIKYWGNVNPIGKIITSEGNPSKITHVFEDLPVNSHFKYDVLYSDDIPLFNDPDEKSMSQNHWYHSFYTYLVMPVNYNVNDFNKISDSYYEKHMAEMGKQKQETWRAWLQPLTDIHYNSDVGFDEPTGNKHYLYGFTAVGLFILMIACINYMNLATARATKRAKEVGMRKILNSGRASLLVQFLFESIFLSFIAMLLGYALVEIILNLTPVNQLLETNLTLDLRTEPQLLGWMLLFSLLLGIISGLYPAIYLSSIAPMSALVGSHKSGKGSIRTREFLVLIQFIITVTVIACTLLLALQMQYISKKALGFNKENRIIVTLRSADIIEKVLARKNDLLKYSDVLGISLCDQIIGKVNDVNIPLTDNENGVPERLTIKTMLASEDYIKVMGIELIEGKDFPKITDADKSKYYLVSEAAVKKMGWSQPLGKHMDDGKVIGVIKDFHYDSLKNNIAPFAIRRFRNVDDTYIKQREVIVMYLAINIAQENIHQTINYLEEKFEEIDKEHPFEFEFLDASLNKLYLSEQRLMTLIGLFAGICIFISCMGLFGLMSFTTEQRRKEIGIRKVLGASTGQIITMLARNIEIFILAGSVIASLVAYYVMDEWLTDFAYRININKALWVFLLAALIAMLVAFITVVLQSFKAAKSDPVEALKYE